MPIQKIINIIKINIVVKYLGKIKQIIKFCLPYGLVTKLILKKTIHIPKFRLKAKHTDGAIIVANRDEMLKLLPKKGCVAEIGVDKAEFSQKILKISKPKKLVLIDTYSSSRYGENKAKLVYEKFSKDIFQNKINIIRKLSFKAASQFNDSYFDWIYLDTDHTYDTTIKELYAYKEKIKKKGFIAGHDYVMGNWNKQGKYGVIEAVAEFCVKENWKIFCLTADFTENLSFVIKKI